MKIRARVSCLTACLCAAPLAHALGLGGISGSGGPTVPLDAYVALYLAPRERAQITGVTLLPEISLDAGADSVVLAKIAARVEQQGDGAFVRLTSAAPLPVERLRFRLRITTSAGAVTGHYDLRLPALQAALAPVTGRSRDIVARPAAPRRTAGGNATAPAPGKYRYGPVRSGESLWLIAKRLTGGRDLARTMAALHALNPDAFVGGDEAKLRVGVTLQLPVGLAAPGAAADIAQASAKPARREEDAAPIPRAAPKAAILRRETDPGARGSAAGPARERPLRDPELAARLAELDAKFAALRARYGNPAASASVAAAVTTTLPTPATTTPAAVAAEQARPLPSAAPAQPVAPPVLQAAVDAAQVIPAASAAPARPDAVAQAAPVAAQARPRSSGERRWPVWLAGGALLLALAGWGARQALRRRLDAPAEAPLPQSRNIADADRRAQVSRKAEQRVRLESEIKGMMDRKQFVPAAGSLASSVLDHATTPLPALGPATGTWVGEQAGEQTGREFAIDANIAHGNYAEAEALLRESIADNPDNVQAKLRLVELFYITEQAERFAELAADLKSKDRGSLSDEEWKRVVRMGKILAPELLPFSGPKLVGVPI